MKNLCRFCVAPKRRAGCHGKCIDYATWKIWNDFKVAEDRYGYEADEVLIRGALRSIASHKNASVSQYMGKRR